MAAVDVTRHFTVGQNTLGDPIETLDVDIASNIPLTFEADTRLFINGVYHEEAGCGSDPIHTCIVKSGSAHMSLFWPQHAPRGSYRFVVTIYSYAGMVGSEDVIFQEAKYQDWVGPLGAMLAGNPLALHDPNHPAVLNLQRVITFTN
jgi:hypothetical protein